MGVNYIEARPGECDTLIGMSPSRFDLMIQVLNLHIQVGRDQFLKELRGRDFTPGQADAIRELLKGNTYMSPQIEEAIVKSTATPAPSHVEVKLYKRLPRFGVTDGRVIKLDLPPVWPWESEPGVLKGTVKELPEVEESKSEPEEKV